MIAVLLEVFSAVFRPYSTLPEGTLRWFKITFGSLLLVTAVTAIYLPGPAPGSFVNTVMVVNRSASLIFCGAFSFTALFSSYYGIPWQSRTYGIGVGFLIYMSVDLFVASLSVMYGSAAANALRSVSMLGYSLSLIVWLNYFAKPEISPLTPSLEQLKSLRTALDYPARKAESFRETL
jgi:ABC-type transport system involved in multi-copper enzyme maturation permease subunit